MDVKTIRRLLTPILERKGAEKAILFGSFARGTADDRSDVDLIIVDDEPLRYLDRLSKYFDDLSATMPCPVDLFVYTQAEFSHLAGRPFVGRAVHDGQVVYERRKAPV